MTGVAENIAYLRSILSIVAEETGALKMEDADEDSVGWTTEGPLPMTFGHVRRAHAALAALEAALSAAEPVAWMHPIAGWVHVRKEVIEAHCQKDGSGPAPLYAAPPAPSVAVKALEWKAHNEGFGHGRMHYGTGAFGHWYGVSIVKTGCWGCVHHIDGKAVHLPMAESLEAAKAAAQTDYEARIRSALSAQVQDVAGAETTTRFHIEWIAGARPPVHPNPMTGRTTFESFERAVQHMKSQADDAQFVSLEERRTTIVHIDRSADMRAALPAAPSQQEGKHASNQ